MGTFTLNGQRYKAVCDCTAKNLSSIENMEKCKPSQAKIRQDLNGEGASMMDVKKLIGDVNQLKYTYVPTTMFKALDGRVQGPALTTPGGDAGEFILSLVVYQDMRLSGEELTDGQVLEIFKKYLIHMKPQ